MKKFLLIILVISTYSSALLAAPMFGEKHSFQQPDGSIIQLRLFGDEFYMRAETMDGYTVIFDEDSDWIVYADLNDDGSELVSTGVP